MDLVPCILYLCNHAGKTTETFLLLVQVYHKNHEAEVEIRQTLSWVNSGVIRPRLEPGTWIRRIPMQVTACCDEVTKRGVNFIYDY